MALSARNKWSLFSSAFAHPLVISVRVANIAGGKMKKPAAPFPTAFRKTFGAVRRDTVPAAQETGALSMSAVMIP